MSESTNSTGERRAAGDRAGSDPSNVSLRVQNLRKTFGDEVAVDDLSLEIEDGHLKSLLGPSGCGKTTTLRCIAGLERPDSGRIYIDGELVSAPEEGVHVEPENRGLGMVFQSYAVWPHMTVAENVRYPLKVQGIGSKQERTERVADVLEAVGLSPYADNLATNLSGGQQQRVAISRALVVEPDILLFDEPLSNLDAKLRREMRLEISRIYHEFDTTVLYVTHSQDEAMFLSDEISIMLDGSIVEEGPPATLHSDPRTFFGMNFMGRCNTIRGEVTSIDDDAVVVDTAMGELTSTHPMDELAVHQQAYACFRPKFCTLLLEGAEAPAGAMVFDGRVDMRAATRDFTEYQIDVGETQILVRTPEPLPVTEGDPARFALTGDDVKVFEFEANEGLVEEATGAADADDEQAGEEDTSVAVGAGD